MDITISSLQRDAYEIAEAYYLTHWNDNHTRKDTTDWDESIFITWARLWLIAMHTYDSMNEGNALEIPDDTPYTKKLLEAYNADFEECLMSMYG